MKIWEWNEKEYFLITLTEEQAYEKIKEYYKKEGFKGEINFFKNTEFLLTIFKKLLDMDLQMNMEI